MDLLLDSLINLLIALLEVVLLAACLLSGGYILVGLPVALNRASRKAMNPLEDADLEFAAIVQRLRTIEEGQVVGEIPYVKTLVSRPPEFNEQERIQSIALPILRKLEKIEAARRAIPPERTLLRSAGPPGNTLLKPAGSADSDNTVLLRPGE
jgi:hypothetical protein